MKFDPNNKIVQLCAEGIELEGQGKPAEAKQHFEAAWNIANTDVEKFTAAHYVARHQESIEDKLKWDETALTYALNIKDGSTNAVLPSLYLNIGKSYEELNELEQALRNYQAALSYASHLPDDGYGDMIRAGIKAGLDRLSNR